MPTSLNKIRAKFLRRLQVVDSAFERHLVTPVVKLRADRYALQEGLISHLWQYWNIFCRELVLASTQGALTKAGALTTSPYSANTEAEVAYVARKLSRRENIGTIRALSGSHLEPTWGDVAKLNLISAGIGSTNHYTLLTAFGVASSIQDLQLCRNACAHLNAENRIRVHSASVRYIQSGFTHPSDLMFWAVPSTRDFAWRAWIEEMEIISDYAIS